MDVKEYETLLKQAYRTAPIGLCFIDTDLRYRHINEWLASINGISVEAHRGRLISEVNPDISSRTESILRQVMETGEPVINDIVEAETKAQPHEKRMFQCSYHAIKSGEGITVGVSCIVQDITEGKRTEEDLRESEERYLSLSEASFEGIMIHDKGRVIDANTRIRDIFGYSLEELIKMSAFELVAPEDRELVRQNVTDGYEGSYEAVGLRKDSSTFPMELQARHMQYRGRRVRVVACRDITERKRAEETLREGEERYLSLSEASFEGLLIHDRGKVIDANTRFQEMFGYRLEELIGMSAYELVAPNDREEIQRNVAEGNEKPHEAVGLRKDSTTFPMEIQVRHMQYRGKRVRVAACQDITERRRAEEALIAQAETERLLLRELDHRVRNNLASLISLIDLSRSGADTVEAFAESIKGRAQTIASVHSALSRSKWHAIELRSLLNTLMVIGDDGHIKFDGPAVIIPPEQAQAVGLIAHELATNSRKYGALSRPNGSVVVSWEEQLNESGARQVHIRWLETGGPPIETEPKPGTGMSLISGLVNYELRGQVSFRFPGHGADHTIAIPLTTDSKAK